MLIKHYLLPMLTAILVCYPIYGALLLAVDTAYGTRQLLQWIAFESKHLLLKQEIADVLASLPVSAPTVLITTFIALVSWRMGGIKPWAIALTAVAIIPALVFAAIGFTPAQAALFASVILLSAIAATLCSSTLNHAKH